MLNNESASEKPVAGFRYWVGYWTEVVVLRDGGSFYLHTSDYNVRHKTKKAALAAFAEMCAERASEPGFEIVA